MEEKGLLFYIAIISTLTFLVAAGLLVLALMGGNSEDKVLTDKMMAERASQQEKQQMPIEKAPPTEATGEKPINGGYSAPVEGANEGGCMRKCVEAGESPETCAPRCGLTLPPKPATTTTK
jgi:hypothetical protein